jgi:hypothetical protein
MEPVETQVIVQNQQPTPEGGETNELEALRVQLAEAQAAMTQAQAAALEAYRGKLLAENAGSIVGELVRGSTAEELAASVEQARAAYTTIAEQVRASIHVAPAPLPTSARSAAAGAHRRKHRRPASRACRPCRRFSPRSPRATVGTENHQRASRPEKGP